MERFSLYICSIYIIVFFGLLPGHAIAAKHALVIGNDNYKHLNGLKKARSDADSIAKVLNTNGYSVTKKHDLTDTQMKDQVREFVRSLKKDDEVIFFYAGHGVQISNTNFLLGTDIQGQDEIEIRDKSLQLQRVLDDFSEKKLKFTLAIIDACRDNPFQVLGRDIGSRGLAPTNPVTGQMIIYSAGTNQQALDRLGDNDASPNSVFTTALIDEFGKGRRSIRQVLLDVRRTVAKKAGSIRRQQVPAIYDQMIDDIYIGSTVINPTVQSNTTDRLSGLYDKDPEMVQCRQLFNGQYLNWKNFLSSKQYNLEQKDFLGSMFFNLKNRSNDSDYCDNECGLAIAKKLNFFTSSAIHYSSGYKSANRDGCVGYRSDIFGSREGAICIIKMLGEEDYKICETSDGFPYTITPR